MKKEVVVILVFLFLAGCSSNASFKSSFESMNYELSECVSHDKEDELYIEGDTFLINHLIEINCCFEPIVTYKIKDGILRIYEDFSGEECDCKCNKELTIVVNEDDISEVEVYSRPYEDWPYERILEKLR